MPVSVSSGSASFPAILENATAAGLGLAAAVGVREGSELQVQMPDGRTLTGVVRWVRFGKVGVRLLTPMSAADPLLRPTVNTPR